MPHGEQIVKYQFHMEKVIYYEQKCVEYSHHKKYYKRYFKKYCYHKKMLHHYHKKGCGHYCPPCPPIAQPLPQVPPPQYQPSPLPAKEQPIYQPQYQPAPYPTKEHPIPYTPPQQQFVPLQRDDLAYPSRSLEYSDYDYDDY